MRLVRGRVRSSWLRFAARREARSTREATECRGEAIGAGRRLLARFLCAKSDANVAGSFPSLRTFKLLVKITFKTKYYINQKS